MAIKNQNISTSNSSSLEKDRERNFKENQWI